MVFRQMKRISRVGGVMSCVVLALSVAAFGQDVTVAPIAPQFADDPPEQLPAFKRPLRPDFPPSLRKTTDVGWAMVDLFVDERGTVLAWQTYATQPLLKEAVTEAATERAKIEPARRAGKPVNANVRMAIVFNPASANSKLADATPRLLDAAVVVDPQLAGNDRSPIAEPAVVWVTAAIDAQGRLTELREVAPDLQPLLARELRAWRFAPARHGGAPVAADLRLPVMIIPPPKMRSKDFVPARPIHRVDPVYPSALLRSRLRGEVVMEFTVDVEGRVRNASVVRSLNPAFDDAALEAIAKWKFEPARYRNVPVNSRSQIPVHFSVGSYGGGDDGIETLRRGDMSKLPPQLQYDVAPKPKSLLLPKYPYALLRDKVYGKAEVSLLITPSGHVSLTKVVKADRPEFGLALQAACEAFQYEPALKNAKPTHALLGFEQEFDRSDRRVFPEAERNALTLEQKHPDRIVSARRLDHPLKPRVAKAPLYPSALLAGGTKGAAVIEFLVGEDGKVLLPRIVSSSAPEFGYAAAQAVGGWQFSEPTVAGKPVITRVQVPFDFSPPAEPVQPAPAAPAAQTQP